MIPGSFLNCGGPLCSSPALNSCHLHLFVCQSKCEMITAALVRGGLKETISAAPAGSLRRLALFFLSSILTVCFNLPQGV